MALAVSLVAPRVLAVTIPSWLVEAMSKSPIFQTTVQSKGPPVARNWKVAPIIKEIFRGETVRGGYTVTGAGFEVIVTPE